MRSISINSVHFQVPPDTKTTILLAAATAQAIDYPTDAHLVRLTGLTTAGAEFPFYANMNSTAAALPSSGTTATTSTTGVSVPVVINREFAVSAGATGWSCIAHGAGYVTAEFWKR